MTATLLSALPAPWGHVQLGLLAGALAVIAAATLTARLIRWLGDYFDD